MLLLFCALPSTIVLQCSSISLHCSIAGERLPRRSGQLLHPREPTHGLAARRTRTRVIDGDSGKIFRDSYLRRYAAQLRTVQRTDFPQSFAATTTIDRVQV